MKQIPNVGWAFFGLAVIILAFYALNRGLFVGSSIAVAYDGGSRPFYHQTCHYLYLNGIEHEEGGRRETREEAEYRCPILYRSWNF